MTKKLQRALKGFEPGEIELSRSVKMRCLRIDRNDIPVPALVFYMFVGLLQCPWEGKGEKVRWTIHAKLNSEPVIFTLQKFGFKICLPVESELTVDRIVGQIRSGLKYAEDQLAPYAEDQFDKNLVIMRNLYYEFEDRYQYFRTLSSKAFNTAKAEAPKPSVDESQDTPDISSFLSGFVESWNYQIRHKTEGFYLTTAMVDAYFSLLEHRLLLLLPFTGQTLEEGDLLKFLSMKWDERFTQIVEIGRDSERQAMLARLRHIKAKIRNPISHGGVENDKGSFQFHIKGAGGVPVNLSEARNSIRFNVFPVEDEDHRSICDFFDEVDEVFRQGHLEIPNKLATSGIDPSFSPDAISRYKKALSSVDEADKFMEFWHYENDKHDNMDF